ncbi:hypothetical protein C3942_09060 [Solimonas fluminis]|uniref:Uncharacterized protein n=1 Tax=Solimonas fluminis TaxID=2086571 RepID=A0A2S5TGR6_9GAMM|nr:hypothetical protein [Solimonas fluminis]PPE74173.1 hypothetical protein C3942_09060 [Solimonas fluminis]
MKLAGLPSLLLLVALSAQAGATYTPEQLQLMIPLGRYPAEGPVSKREVFSMSWSECLTRSDNLAASAKSPALRLVDAPGLRSTKIWAGDGSLTISCRIREGMELSRSPYR